MRGLDFSCFQVSPVPSNCWAVECHIVVLFIKFNLRQLVLSCLSWKLATSILGLMKHFIFLFPCFFELNLLCSLSLYKPCFEQCSTIKENNNKEVWTECCFKSWEIINSFSESLSIFLLKVWFHWGLSPKLRWLKSHFVFQLLSCLE